MRLRLPLVVTSSLSAILVVLLGVLTLSKATDSFAIWTAEDARRVKVLSDPSEIPNSHLLNHRKERRPLISNQKQFVVLDFIYTRCPTVCNTLGFKFKQLQNKLVDQELDAHVEVLSVSFDLNHDSPLALQRYLNLHKAGDSIWSALIPRSRVALKQLIQRFGVVVIEDEFGGFTHNAAIYIIEDGHLKKIFNDDEIDSAVSYIKQRVTQINTIHARG